MTARQVGTTGWARAVKKPMSLTVRTGASPCAGTGPICRTPLVLGRTDALVEVESIHDAGCLSSCFGAWALQKCGIVVPTVSTWITGSVWCHPPPACYGLAAFHWPEIPEK